MSRLLTNRRVPVALAVLALLAAPRLRAAPPLRAGPVEFAPMMLGPGPLLLWDTSLSLRSGMGYSSNPSLAYASENPEPSGFFEYGGDLMFFRLPTDGNTAYIFLSGDDRRYFSADDVPGEQTFLVQFKYDHESTSWWNAGGSLTWVYAHQVLDLLNLDSGLVPTEIRGNTVILRPTFSARLSTNWLAGFELPMTIQGFGDAADGYSEIGPLLQLTRRLRHKSQVSVGYGWAWRPYDDSPMMDPDEEVIPAPLELLRYNNVSLRWQQNWDAQKTWTTTLRTGFTTARDDGEGNYNYNRIRAGGAAQYQVGRWTFGVDGGADWYNYLASSGETALQDRQEYTLNFQVAFDLTKAVKWLVRFNWEKSLANIPEDTYTVRTASSGFEWEF